MKEKPRDRDPLFLLEKAD